MKVYLVKQTSSNNGAWEESCYRDDIVGVFSTENSARAYIMGLTEPVSEGVIDFWDDFPKFPEEAKGVKFYNVYHPERPIIERDHIPESFDPEHRFSRMIYLGHDGETGYCNFYYSIVPMEVLE